jgi:hypothetical protein
VILLKHGSKSSECWFSSIPTSRYWSKSNSRSKAWNWDWYNSSQLIYQELDRPSVWKIYSVFS